MDRETLERAIELRHRLHMNPELSGEERETKKTLIDYLQTNSSLEIVDRGAWFYAKYKCPEEQKKKPAVALRADFDAIKVLEENDLPYCSVNKGVAHKCGHDGHAGALCAFAEVLSKEGADRDVYLVFQHGEETGIGGEPASAVIEEENISEVYAIHNYPGKPFGSFNLRAGTVNFASMGMELDFQGTPTHASTPELGKNPALAISRLVTDLPSIIEKWSNKGIVLATVVQIELGERAFGVSASEGKLLLTVRGEYQDEFDGLAEEIKAFAYKYAKEDGLELEISYHDVFPQTYNHEKSVEKIIDICDKNNWEYIEMESPLRTSEDFGYFTQKTKGALIWLGAGESAAPLHDRDFDYNDSLIERSCAVFSQLIK